MLKHLLLICSFLLTFIASTVNAAQNTHILIATSEGEIEVELFNNKAPLTVDNFLYYVRSGFYDNLLFHRVIPDFMIQGGGYDENFNYKAPTKDPVQNEAKNGEKNLIGTISMARTSIINSATTQFFINVADNPSLDHSGLNSADFGYAVFGKVIKGLDIADTISRVDIQAAKGHYNIPIKPIVIYSIKEMAQTEVDEKNRNNSASIPAAR